MDYWKDRARNAAHAEEHTERMEKLFDDQIQECIKATKVYNSDFKFKPVVGQAPTIKLRSFTSTEAIERYHTGKTAVLNFASYTHAGGKFTEGSMAQEESLCHSSFLYNVLREKQDYYDLNLHQKNRALYTNRALYSPDVAFFTEQDGPIYVDVITCAAPNKGVAMKYNQVSPAELTKVLKERIQFVLKIAAANRVETLILGAYGCGVFKQDPHEVAKIFKEELSKSVWPFNEVVFAVPEKTSENYKAFNKVF